MAVENDAIEFTYSAQGLIRLLFGGLVLTLLSGAIALHIIPNVRPGSMIEFVGYVGVLFFGLGTFLFGWRLLTHRGPVVTLTRSGFRDVRLAAEEIHWTAISALGRVTIRNQDFLVFAVNPDIEAGLTLTRVARWSREPNRKLGIDGLCTTAVGLNTTFETLYDLCDMNLRRVHHGEPEGSAERLPVDFSLRASDRI